MFQRSLPASSTPGMEHGWVKTRGPSAKKPTAPSPTRITLSRCRRGYGRVMAWITKPWPVMKIRPEEHAGTTAPNSASFDWRLWLFVLSAAAVLCSFNLGGARSLTEHEIQIGASAKEMAIDHDWLVPKIGGH